MSCQPLRICTYNVLNETFAQKYKSSLPPTLQNKTRWNDRSVVIVNNIKQADPDILAIQEVSKAAFTDLLASMELMGYTAIFTPHQRTDVSDGVAIFYKNARFFKTSDAPISHSASTKKSLIVTLSDRQTNRVIRIASCHLDGGSIRTPGNTQLQEIVSGVNYDRPDVSIICGDFNANSTDPRLATLQNAGYTNHVASYESERGRNRIIDYICYKDHKGAIINKAEIPLGRLPEASDHNMVGINLSLRNVPADAPAPRPAPVTVPLSPPAAPSAAPSAPHMAPVAAPAAPIATAPTGKKKSFFTWLTTPVSKFFNFIGRMSYSFFSFLKKA